MAARSRLTVLILFPSEVRLFGLSELPTAKDWFKNSPEVRREWNSRPTGSDGLEASVHRQTGPRSAHRAVRKEVGIRCGAISDNMKVSCQAARSIG